MVEHICKPHTHALTSNRKFIRPNACVYKMIYTPMLRYPGMNGVPIRHFPGTSEEPEEIKSFRTKKCKTCSFM